MSNPFDFLPIVQTFKALSFLKEVIDGNDDTQTGNEIRADKWRVFDWADQADPADPPKIIEPPKTLYQLIDINISAPPEIPDRRLPKEEDGQTDTKTVGSSVSVKESLKNRKFGKLLWNPIKKGKDKLRLAYDPNLGKKLNQDLKDGEEDYQNWLKAQVDPEYWVSEDYTKSENKFWGGFALVRPAQLKGHQGNFSIAYGVDWISTVSQSYHLCSLNAYMPIRDFIYEQSEVRQRNIPRKNAKKPANKNIELTSDSSLFYRLGLHRFPATLPEYLVGQGEEADKNTVTISDNVSLQEWMIKNLDALFGEFPLQMKYKNIEGEEQLLQVNNLAETLAEFMGIMIDVATNSDTSIQLGFKNLVETTKAANSAIAAFDYAKGNAEYLGYRGKEKNRKIKISYSPGKESISEALKESEVNVVGFENIDKETLREDLGKAMIILQILKAGSYFPWKPGQSFTGDDIRKRREEETDKKDKDWQAFLSKLNNPSGINKIPNNPIPKIKDIDTTKNND
jgi:hypothetical protein